MFQNFTNLKPSSFVALLIRGEELGVLNVREHPLSTHLKTLIAKKHPSNIKNSYNTLLYKDLIKIKIII